MTKLELHMARAEKAYANYRELMEFSRDALKWARTARRNGDREDYLDLLRQAEHWRIRALDWYRKYQKVSAKIAQEVA